MVSMAPAAHRPVARDWRGGRHGRARRPPHGPVLPMTLETPEGSALETLEDEYTRWKQYKMRSSLPAELETASEPRIKLNNRPQTTPALSSGLGPSIAINQNKPRMRPRNREWVDTYAPQRWSGASRLGGASTRNFVDLSDYGREGSREPGRELGNFSREVREPALETRDFGRDTGGSFGRDFGREVGSFSHDARDPAIFGLDRAAQPASTRSTTLRSPFWTIFLTAVLTFAGAIYFSSTWLQPAPIAPVRPAPPLENWASLHRGARIIPSMTFMGASESWFDRFLLWDNFDCPALLAEGTTSSTCVQLGENSRIGIQLPTEIFVSSIRVLTYGTATSPRVSFYQFGRFSDVQFDSVSEEDLLVLHFDDLRANALQVHLRGVQTSCVRKVEVWGRMTA